LCNTPAYQNGTVLAPMTNAVQLLREYGLRATPQRILLVEVARNLPGHFTAEGVFERMKETYPTLSVVSVYRGLETLRELGLVTRTELGGDAAAYEWTEGERHHHLICTNCGCQTDLDDAEMIELRQHLLTRYGFHAAIDHLAIFGLCSFCADEQNQRLIAAQDQES